MFKSKSIFKSQSEENLSENDASEDNGPDVSAQTVESVEKVKSDAIKPIETTSQQTAEDPSATSMKMDLSPEDIARYQSLRSKMVSASFGEIVTLLMRSPHYRHYTLADLEWLVVPPLLTNQFLVVEAKVNTPAANQDTITDETSKESAATGVRIPVGMALWAKVSPEVDAKLSENLSNPIKLRPDEWRSGEINWLVEIFGDEKVMQGLYEKLKNDVFKGETFKVRAQNKDGQKFVKEVVGGTGDGAAKSQE